MGDLQSSRACMQAKLERYTRRKLYAMRPCMIQTVQTCDGAELHEKHVICALCALSIILSGHSCSITIVRVSKLADGLLQEKVSEADVEPEALGMLRAR